MSRKAGPIAGGARGQNLVEFAISLTVLLLLLAAIADLGRAFYTYVAVANAAREGARYYSRMSCVASNEAALRAAVADTVVNEALASGITIPRNRITLEPSSGCPTQGQPVRVEAVYTFTSMIGSVPMLGGGRFSFGVIPLGHVATMVYQGSDVVSP